MEATDGRADADITADVDESQTTVSVHRSSPDRVVFTEENNTDGWIATDLVVELDR